jgi:hypothetical protein
MKNLHTLIIFWLIVIFNNSTGGEVFDDFTKGEFSMSSSGQDPQQVSSSNDSDFFSKREVQGYGFSGKNWTASLAPETGGIDYSVIIDPPQASPRTFLGIRYINDEGPFDFSGFDSFEIKYTNYSGKGELLGFLGSFPTFGVEFSKPFDESGSISIPISQLGTPEQIRSSQQLEFRFIVSQDRFGVSEFGINIQEISIVPEPTTWSLLLLGGAPWVWRRFRAMASRKL